MSRTTYHIARAGRQLCAVDAAQLVSRVQAGSLKPSDLYWTQGMANWKPLSGLGSLSSHWPGATAVAVQPSAVGGASQTLRPAQKDGGPACCPSCGNKNVKSARHLYLIGTRDSSTTGGSIGWGSNSNPRTWVSTRTSASRLAADLAPPEKKLGCGCLLVPIVFLMPIGLAGAMLGKSESPVAFAIVGIIGLLVGSFLAAKVFKQVTDADQKAEQDYQKKMAEWERLWYCNKCSERFLW